MPAATITTSTMVVDLQPGQSISIDGTLVRLVHKAGRSARLVVVAPRDVAIVKQARGTAAAREDSRGVPSIA